MIILDSAVGNVASELKVLKISGFVENFFESSAHLHGEKKFSRKSIRFKALSSRSSFKLLHLGLSYDQPNNPRQSCVFHHNLFEYLQTYKVGP
jgi:hypothetical protein